MTDVATSTTQSGPEADAPETVTMPLEYRFPESVREVFIRRDGESVVLTPRPSDWSGFFASGMKASTDFMADIERMPIQERSF